MNKKVINILGDITDVPYFEGDMSSVMMLKELEGDYDEIVVNINSFGGSVAEGLSIFNQLKQHKAKVTTVCQGFACSIASIIFLAGDERVICDNSLVMIHNPWTVMQGDANSLRKEADVLDKIAQQSVDIYCQATGLNEETIKQMMDEETWLDSKEALELGFATTIQENSKVDTVVQSVKQSLIGKIKMKKEDDIKEDDIKEDDIIETQENVQEQEQENVQQTTELNIMSSFLNLFK